MEPSAYTARMTSLGDSFAWAFRDQAWLGKVVVQGLILIIPIIGWIAGYGWLLMCMDNIRAGRPELPPAGFHLGRGIHLFGVLFIYGLVIAIPVVILGVLGAVLVAQNGSGGAGGALVALAQLLEGVAGLLLAFLSPALYVATWRGGFAAGLDVGAVWRLATANVTNSVLAALIFLVAGFIGSIGFILCVIGFVFTTVYGYTVIAGAATWFDQVSSGGQAPAPAGPPTY